MRYFKDSKDGFYAVVGLNVPLPDDFVEITDAEAAAIRAALIAAQPVVIPTKVTMRQARLALLNAGLLQTVNNAIAAMPSPQGDAARIEWEFSSEVHRNQPLVMSLAPALNMTDAQLDQLFIDAAKL